MYSLTSFLSLGDYHYHYQGSLGDSRDSSNHRESLGSKAAVSMTTIDPKHVLCAAQSPQRLRARVQRHSAMHMSTELGAGQEDCAT